MERPTSKPSKAQMEELLKAADEERIRNMPLPETKPNAEKIASMEEAGRQEYSDNRQRVINHLKKRGLSNAAIAGIIGNIDVETGGSFDYQQRQTKSGNPRDPETVEGGGYGLFQFDDPKNKAGHESWYKEYLKQTGKEDSAESQLDYFLDMINAGEDTQDPFYKFSKNMGARNAGTIKGYFQVNKNPQQISDAITDRFENPGIQHSDRRRASAEAAFAELEPSERSDVDPNAQYIDQPGTIADTGDDVKMKEPGLFEKIKPYIPVVRHFDEGGMAKQMKLFEDGGLKQEGGTVDPVSGNDVPPGSTQEEVRDDIPAQLSEGEFVFPADVVRYIGLEKLMEMRQEAKQGLQTMEDMGQMGNGDEAIMPDDIPFDLSDLDMEDDLEYNVGGFVPGVQQQQQFTGIAGYRPPQMQQGVGSYVSAPMPQYQTTPIAGAYTPPQQAAVPTMQPPTQMPQFEQFTEQNVDNREYTNSETGEKRVFTFINGQPTIPIPAGFVPSSEYVKPETSKPADTTVETTRVVERDDSDDARRRKEEEEMYGPGGGRLGVGKNIYGVSFDGVGMLEGRGLLAGLAFSGKIPDKYASDVSVNIKRGKDEFSIRGDEYNELKKVIEESGANSPSAKNKMNELRQRSAAIKEAKRKAQEEFDRLAKLEEGEEKRKRTKVEPTSDDSDGRGPFGTGYTYDPQSVRETTEYVQSGYEQEAGGGGASSGGGRTESAGADWSQPDSSASVGSQSDYDKMYGNQGGLASKKKPKTKKMKQGGLASKK